MPAMDKAEDDDSTVNNNNQDLAKRKRSASHSSVDEEGPRRKQVRSASVVRAIKIFRWIQLQRTLYHKFLSFYNRADKNTMHIAGFATRTEFKQFVKYVLAPTI